MYGLLLRQVRRGFAFKRDDDIFGSNARHGVAGFNGGGSNVWCQNNIIKIFSVAAVIFLPPTLIASVYGMNFHDMPELYWRYGYLLALGLMIISAILPYRFFKAKKWL